MKRLLTLLFAATAIAAAAQQTVTIKGKVISKEDNLPVIGATIILNAQDSAKLSQPGRAIASDVDGNFTIISREPKSELTIQFLGFAKLVVPVAEGQRAVDLGTMYLEPSAVGLDAAVIIAQGSMALIKGDTIQFNASNFKTNPDATAEDLVKKMPGVTVGTDGAISAQGETVQKVLVNGKEYFDNDPTSALRNLPSDAIENIQFVDGQSDEARFSGMDDGQRIKTINIITKKNVLQSAFGRAWAGYGSDGRYSTGLNANVFNDTQRFTITAGSNNVNGQGFQMNDVGGMGGGMGRGMIRVDGLSSNLFQTNAWGGITQSSNFGLNYNGSWADKLKIQAQYSFMNANSLADSESTLDQINMNRYTESANRANSLNNRHNFSTRIEWTPQKTDRIFFNARASYGLNKGNTYSESVSRNRPDTPIINAALNSYDRKYDSYNVGGDLWWQHALPKAGRTWNIGGQASVNKNFGDSDQFSLVAIMMQNQTGGLLDTTIISRLVQLNSSGYNLSGSLTYNEPLTKLARLSVNYNLSYNRTIAYQDGWNWDEMRQQYDYLNPDAATTNHLNRNYTTQTMGLNYNYNKDKKINLTAGVDYLVAGQNNDQWRPSIGNIYNKFTFTAWQPNVRLRWTPKTGHNLNFNLRRNSGFPSISQLQDVLDVTDPLRVTKGNPDLSQSYTNSIMGSYNFADMTRNANFNAMIGANFQEQSIVSDTRILARDTVINGTALKASTQFTSYRNMDGAQSVFGFASYSFGIKPIRSNMSLGANYNYNRRPSIQNGREYLGTSNQAGLNMRLISNISENVDFTLGYMPSLQFSDNNSGRDNSFNRYINHRVTGIANVYLTKWMFINADGSWINNYGTVDGSEQHYYLVNAAIGFKFLPNRSGELKLQCYDIFEQQRSYMLSVDANNNISTTTNFNILKRYLMLSFMYKFDTRTAGNTQGQSTQMEQRIMMGPGGGGPPMGGGNVMIMRRD